MSPHSTNSSMLCKPSGAYTLTRALRVSVPTLNEYAVSNVGVHRSPAFNGQSAVSKRDNWAIPSRVIPGNRYRLPEVGSWPVPETSEGKDGVKRFS